MTKSTKHKAQITATIALCFLFYFLTVQTVLAQISSTSASPKTTATPTPQAESSSTSAVRDKVRQTIQNLSHKAKAVIGTLDQISDSTLQIKNPQGKLSQVATQNDTSYSKVSGSKKTDIKFTDLAIGDFIAALGYRNGNDILSAKRVIVFDKEPQNSNRAFWASVDNNSKGVIRVALKNDDSWTVETTKKIQVLTKTEGKIIQDGKIDDLIGGDRIIAIGQISDKKDKTLMASKIVILSSLGSKPTNSPTPKATNKPTVSPKPSLTPSTQ